MKKFRWLGVFLAMLGVSSCEEDQEVDTGLTLEKVSGYVQKGPYLNGTAITISELDKKLVPTGKNFTSQILDNKGTFEINDVRLKSQYVELRADGFYFNEVANENSVSQLTLFALSDLADHRSLNVNILSHLEKSRVEYLISSGSEFAAAKQQAQQEILAIFNIDKSDIPESERLDISQTGEDNAILLAISVILQGYLPVADLSELLANINTDLREDGVLDSQILGSTLINHARTLKLDQIRQNLERRYETMGVEVSIPDFEAYVEHFIQSTDFEFTHYIEYPTHGKYGVNLLDRDQTEYTSTGHCSMKAVLPEGTSLRVNIKGTNWGYIAFQENSGWDPANWDDQDHSRFFSSMRAGELDLEMDLTADQDSIYHGIITVTVFENESEEPTWTKEITVK